MSPGIWERAGAEAQLRAMSLRPYRVVEAQHLSSTRALVDSLEEQAVLEDSIERAKPEVPGDAQKLHFLLSTPFRYPPLLHGSRFGRATEPGIWYGSKTKKTALAETAYYRLLFLEGTRAALPQLAFELSVFRATVRTRRALDSTGPPFDTHRSVLTSKSDYRATQRLGASARAAHVEVMVYESVRDPDHGANIAVLSPRAFARKKPETPESWVMTASGRAVEVVNKTFFERTEFVFPRSTFLVGGKLPRPA